MAQPTQVRQIRISVDTKGNRDLKALADQMMGVNRSVKSLSGNVSMLKNFFLGYFGALQIGTLARMSDSMQQLNDRITVLSGSTEESARVMQGLLERANRTKTSIDGLATIYSRLAASTEETGISTNSLLSLTETLQNTFRLSGATINEATAAAIQLSQGFASGQLRGQELRSVMEQNVVMAKLLRKEFGNDVYEKASKGLISAASVMKILFNNSAQLASQAAKLGQTFEQTVTVAFNNFKITLLDINKEFDLSGKFARGIAMLMEKFTLLATVSIPIAIAALYAYRTAMIAATVASYKFALANPIAGAFVVLGTVILTAFDNLKEFTDYLKYNFGGVVGFIGKVIMTLGGAFQILAEKFPTNDRFKGLADSLSELGVSLDKTAEKWKTELFAVDPAAEQRVLDSIKARKEEAELLKKLNAQQNKGKPDKLAEILGRINREYASGAISAAEYYKKLDDFEKLKLDRQFAEGKIQLDKFNDGLRELEQRDLARQFRDGAITLSQFNEGLRTLEIQKLNEQLAQGVINLKQYDSELIKISDKLNMGSAFRTGLEDFVSSIGTIGSNVADAVKNTFSNLETSFLDFIKTGKFNFANFTQAILDDLAKIIIRAAIIRPLAQGILGGLSGAGGAAAGQVAGGSYTDVSGFAAKGMAFDGNVRKFAKGGLVNSPTLFGYGGGKTGMMGEAGTEAILPLSRGKGGNLGVEASLSPVTINVINQAGADVEQRESTGPGGERTIELMIKTKVKEQISNGSYDRVMQQSYGLNRRGS